MVAQRTRDISTEAITPVIHGDANLVVSESVDSVLVKKEASIVDEKLPGRRTASRRRCCRRPSLDP